MARQVEKIEMRMRPVDAYEQHEGCDTFTCEGCQSEVAPGDGYVVINKAAYHMKTECIPETARSLYTDLRADLLDNLDEHTDTGFRTLARQLEPHYRGGVRLDQAQIRSLINEEVNKRPPHEILVRRFDDGEWKEATTNVAAQHKEFQTLLGRLSIGHSCWLGGPAGTGKTTAAKNAAEALGIKFYIQTPVSQAYDLFGFEDANGVYHPTALYLWANDPGALLIMDEVDSFAAKALVAAHPAMENGYLMFPGGREVQIPAENNIVATANTWGFGANADYVARNSMDGATSDRFRAFIEWETDEEFEFQLVKARLGSLPERLGVLWHRACKDIRNNLVEKGIKLIWSPRQTLGVVEALVAGVYTTVDDPLKHTSASWRVLVEKILATSALARLPEDQRGKVLQGVSFVRPSEIVAAAEMEAEHAS